MNPEERRLGRWILEDELGRGAMGVVYRAHDTALRRHVAIKLILSANERRLARFLAEARAVARLRHPCIVAIHEVGEDAGRPFLVMDFVEGESLDAALERGALTRDALLAVTRDVARGLEHAHENGIVHRDVKPQNVLIDGSGRGLLTDFGVAFDVTQERQTLTGQLVGTPAYASPEQIAGQSGTVGRATDVWSLGAMLYHGLTGRLPFDAENLGELMAKVLRAAPTPPRKIDPSISPHLARVALRCLEKRPDDRYLSTAAVAEDLDRVLRGEPIERDGLGSTVRRLARTRGGRWGAFVVLLLAIVLAWFAVPRRQPAPLRSLEELRRSAGDILATSRRLRGEGVSISVLASEYLPRIEAITREATARDPKAAWPHYLEGRVLLLARRDEEAARAFDRALHTEPTHREAIFERILLSARRSRDLLDRAQDAAMRARGATIDAVDPLDATRQASIADGGRLEDDYPAEIVEEMRTLRSGIDADIAGLDRLAADDPTWEARRACVRGLAQLCPPHPETTSATGLLEEAVRLDPTLTPAREELCRLLLRAGDWPRLRQLCSEGLELERGSSAFLYLRATAIARLAGRESGDERRRLLEVALTDADLAVSLGPDLAQSWRVRARIRKTEAEDAEALGRDSRRLRESQLADLRRAVELDPSTSMLVNYAIAQQDWARLATEPDVRERRLRDALATYDRAVAASPVEYSPRANRATVWLFLAEVARARQERPERELRAALADLGEAVRLNPSSQFSWGRRGRTRGELAQLLAADDSSFGVAVELAAAADADLGRAITIAVDDNWRIGWLMDRAAFLLAWAHHHAEKAGESPADVYRRAIADLEHAAEIAAGRELWLIWRDLGAALASVAAHVEDVDDDAAASLELWERALAANRAALATIESFLVSPEDDLRSIGESVPRSSVAMVHYNIGCSLARISARGGAYDALRGDAFQSLELAIEHGWRDSAWIRTDADLLSLHTDPRWGELLRRVGGERRD